MRTPQTYDVEDVPAQTIRPFCYKLICKYILDIVLSILPFHVLLEFQEQESVGQEIKGLYDSQLRLLLIIKIITYFLLVYWFWRSPVASISRHLVQPFGKLLSWGTGSLLNDYVMVGIMPWFVLCTRISKLVFRHFK